VNYKSLQSSHQDMLACPFSLNLALSDSVVANRMPRNPCDTSSEAT
jgi:hypothetical protein